MDEFILASGEEVIPAEAGAIVESELSGDLQNKIDSGGSPSDMVTTDTEQTISGHKTFINNVDFLIGPNFQAIFHGNAGFADTVLFYDQTFNIYDTEGNLMSANPCFFVPPHMYDGVNIGAKFMQYMGSMSIGQRTANHWNISSDEGGTLYIAPIYSESNIEITGEINLTGSLTASGNINSGVTPVADGTYTMGAKLTDNGTAGTITVQNGIVTAIQQAT